MSEPLPPFPMDDTTLDRLGHALGGRYEVEPDGARRVVGADYNLTQLLNFYSGYDPARTRLVRPGRDESDVPEWEVGRGGIADAPIYELDRTLYTYKAVISALIAEVRRLRSTR